MHCSHEMIGALNKTKRGRERIEYVMMKESKAARAKQNVFDIGKRDTSQWHTWLLFLLPSNILL